MGQSVRICAGIEEPSKKGLPSRRIRGAKAASWPFWLLVAAWCFANCSQQVSIDLMVWVSHGRHFSHQERLKMDVAALLSGRKENRVVTSAKSEPVRMPVAPVSTESNSRKVDLFASATVEPSAPSVQKLAELGTSVRIPERAVPEPLLTPPKSSTVS
jgi:hypothetical protein